jgi:putative acetyltransferase
MIRKFRENDLPSIMQIWFDSNVEVHSFIPEKYWMDNFEMVKDILPQAEIYVYENLGKISGFIVMVFLFCTSLEARKDSQESSNLRLFPR